MSVSSSPGEICRVARVSRVPALSHTLSLSLRLLARCSRVLACVLVLHCCSNGLPAYTEVSGEIQSLCKLSGMPDLTLSFTNPHILDDVSLHPCVRYNRFETNKVLSFVPPDGNYKLMSYR